MGAASSARQTAVQDWWHETEGGGFEWKWEGRRWFFKEGLCLHVHRWLMNQGALYRVSSSLRIRPTLERKVIGNICFPPVVY